MRYLVLGFCFVAAACGDTPFKSPTAPSSTMSDAASTNANGGSELPFSGTLQATETVVRRAESAQRHGRGDAPGTVHLSVGVYRDPPPVSTASGTATWTAANGDEIFTTVTGHAVVTFPTGGDSGDTHHHEWNRPIRRSFRNTRRPAFPEPPDAGCIRPDRSPERLTCTTDSAAGLAGFRAPRQQDRLPSARR